MKDREDSGDEPDRPSENQNTDGYEHGTNVEDGKTAVNENTGEYYSKGRVFETQGGENPQVGVELFDQFSTEIYFSPGPEEVKVGDHLTVYYYQNPDGSLKFSRYAPAEKPSKKPAKEACGIPLRAIHMAGERKRMRMGQRSILHGNGRSV